MQSKALDTVSRTTEAVRKPQSETPAEERQQKTEERHISKEVEMKHNYEAISKNGDTLELSEDGKKMGAQSDPQQSPLLSKKIISESSKKIPDNILAGYSESKLKQLYINKKISKQQYDRITNRKKGSGK